MQIVQGGDLAWDSVIYPSLTESANNYILNQFNNLSSTLTDVGRQFMSNAYDMFQKLNDSTAVQIAKNAVRRAGEILYMNIIKPLFQPREICQAPVIMQRYIMACPEIRREYQANRITGYSETYFDKEPGRIGEDHYDYRRVMDGVLQEDKEGNFFIKEYIEDIFPDDRELTHREKADVILTWDLAKLVMDLYKEDITDPYNEDSF